MEIKQNGGGLSVPSQGSGNGEDDAGLSVPGRDRGMGRTTRDFQSWTEDRGMRRTARNFIHGPRIGAWVGWRGTFSREDREGRGRIGHVYACA